MIEVAAAVVSEETVVEEAASEETVVEEAVDSEETAVVAEAVEATEVAEGEEVEEVEEEELELVRKHSSYLMRDSPVSTSRRPPTIPL